MEAIQPLFVEGYADQLSVEAGDEIGLHISTSADEYSVEIARVGAKREVVWSKRDLRGAQYAVPNNAATHGCACLPSLLLQQHLCLPAFAPIHHKK